jgi:subtilisin family serine protease
MNKLLELKGKFDQKKRDIPYMARRLPKEDSVVTVEHLISLCSQLEAIYEYWDNQNILTNCLLSVYYNEIIAKSNRLQKLFSFGVKNSNSTIVGAKYVGTEIKKHVITHCVTKPNLQDTIDNIKFVIGTIQTLFGDRITGQHINNINANVIVLPDKTKSKFVGTVVDCFHIEKFNIDMDPESIDINGDQIITLYDTGMDTDELLRKIGITDFLSNRKIDNTTILLFPYQLEKLKTNAPYLVSMSVSNLAELTPEDIGMPNKNHPPIESPHNEPVVGVIDTPFDNSVYFSEWVKDSIEFDEKKFPIQDYGHGTKVSSIIVDGSSFNHNLEDNCGRFRVRHFGVMPGGRFSSFTILQSIKKIVEENRDIKVWNLSLGAVLEVKQNSISPEAAILDKIQYENDVIFVVAGTNKTKDNPSARRIGAPADSINSIVVNAVDENGRPTNYSREGIVLSFFNKPDIGYYGGTKENPLMAYGSDGSYYVMGTSYAAPWITRKVAFLIYKMGLSREIAKALLIDSAVKWKGNEDPSKLIGFGVVPIKIDDIVKSPDDEIKFVMQGTSELYDTYTYKIPVPIYKQKQPYIAKATLCYFPKCNRNQGVDYTNTEMDLHFGRIKPDGKGIATINDNKQNDDDEICYLREGSARRHFRKWDNVKHICEFFKARGSAKTVYGSGLWGLSIKNVDRLGGNDGKGVRFGLVITLKEIKGVNRYQEFKQQCSLKAWLVNEIDVESRINLYNKAEQDIILED